MATYEVEINGQSFEIDAPDDESVKLAVRRLQEIEAPKQEGGGFLDGVNAFGTGIADMASFGFADEIGAAARWAGGKVLPWQENISYGQALDEVRGLDKSIQEKNPGSYLAGQITGGVGAASQMAKAGLSATANLPSRATLGKQMAVGAAEGAALGGLYGIGSGEGIGGRATEGAYNALAGGIVGGAAPAIAAGVGKVYRSFKDHNLEKEMFKKAGVSPEAGRLLTRVMEADGTLGQRGMSNMLDAGQDAMLADAGQNAKQVLDTAIQRGGPGAVVARDAIETRVGRSAKDLANAMNDSLGTPRGIYSAREAVRRGTQAARGTAYDDAFSQAINYADPRAMAIEDIVKTRVPASAIREANALMRAEGQVSKQILADIADDGSVIFQQLPDVRQLDYITRALNDVAKSAEGTGAMGGQTALGRAYEGLSREIRGNLRELVPEYGKALDTAADAIGRSKAIEFGGKLLSPATARDEAAYIVKGMSAAEKTAAAQGVRSQIDEALANVTRTVQDGGVEAREAISSIKKLSSRANRQKIGLLIGDANADKLFQEVDRATKSFELRAAIADNSKTFARQATNEAVKDATTPGTIGKIAQGEPIGAAKRVAQIITRQTPERQLAKQDAIYSEIAKVLTRPAQRSLPALQALTNMRSGNVQNLIQALKIQGALRSVSPRATYPLAPRLVEGMRE